MLIQTAEYLRSCRRVDGQLVCANIAIHGPQDIPTALGISRRADQWISGSEAIS